MAKQMTATYRVSCLLVLLITPFAASPLFGQERNKADNYGFVSPNTRDDLKLNEAIEGMNSAEEASLIKRAQNLGCVVRSKVRVFRTLGSWSDGAEHSVMLRLNSDEESLRYVLARLGRDARQKSVLYFHPTARGTARLYVLRTRTNRRSLQSVTQVLEASGISFRTLAPMGKSIWIYLVDLNRELKAKVRVAARRLRAKVSIRTGKAEFVGADQAIQAQDIFTREVTGYEGRHPNLPPTCDLRPATRKNE